MKFRVGTKLGDTLIEVMFAIGIFSLVAITIVSVMMSGTSNMQTALETTMARNEIDAQAEALRFIHQGYLSEKSAETDEANGVEGVYTKLWKKIVGLANENLDMGLSPQSQALGQVANDLYEYKPATCSELYDNSSTHGLKNLHAFAINTQHINDENAVLAYGDAMFEEASLYPRLYYTDHSGKEGSMMSQNTLLNAIEGIFIVAAPDQSQTNLTKKSGHNPTIEQGKGFYDFYIRSCWYGYGKTTPTAISTLIRLYDPDVEIESSRELDFTLSFDWNGGGECTNLATGETGVPCPVKRITKKLAPGEYFPATVIDNVPADGYSRGLKEPIGWSDKSDTKCNSTTNLKSKGYIINDFANIGNATPFRTYYAVWDCRFKVTYQINYDYDLGTVSESNNFINDVVGTPDVNGNFTVTLAPALTTSNPLRYFVGWECNNYCNGEDGVSPRPVRSGGSTVTVNKDERMQRTYKAKWGRVTTYNYSLAFNMNAGSDSVTGSISVSPFNNTTETSHTFTVPAATLSRTNYEFKGWATSANGSVVCAATGCNYSVNSANSSQTLYAVWEAAPPAVSTYTVAALFSGDVDTYLRVSNGMYLPFHTVAIYSTMWSVGSEYGLSYTDGDGRDWIVNSDIREGGIEKKTFPVDNNLDYVYYARRYNSSADYSVGLTVKKDGVIVPPFDGRSFSICSGEGKYGVLFRISNGEITTPYLGCTVAEPDP